MNRRPVWQKTVAVGAAIALTALCFIHAGVWAFITTLLAFLGGALLGVVVGAEGGRRDNANRIKLLEDQYEHARSHARNAVQAHADAAVRFHKVEEDLRAAHADQARLRARLNELDQPSDLSDLSEGKQPIAEPQQRP